MLLGVVAVMINRGVTKRALTDILDDIYSIFDRIKTITIGSRNPLVIIYVPIALIALFYY